LEANIDMKVTEEGKKKGIKYSPNFDALAINSRNFCENHTLEGIATKHERMADEVISNPRKFRKKTI
jgi:hypothetical protein